MKIGAYGADYREPQLWGRREYKEEREIPLSSLSPYLQKVWKEIERKLNSSGEEWHGISRLRDFFELLLDIGERDIFGLEIEGSWLVLKTWKPKVAMGCGDYFLDVPMARNFVAQANKLGYIKIRR